jgi:lipopolysaccharide export system permease protein
MLYNILIYDHTEKRGDVSVTYADSGRMTITPDKKDLVFNLFHGRSYYEMETKRRNLYSKNRIYPFRQDHFDEQTIIIKLTGFGLKRTDENLFKNHYSMLNLQQLEHFSDSLNQKLQERQKMVKKTIWVQLFGESRYFKKIHEQDTTLRHDSANMKPFDLWAVYDTLQPSLKQSIAENALTSAKGTRDYLRNMGKIIQSHIKYIRRYQIEWHRKFTLSLACIIFFFIGAPLGAIIRRGGLGMPVVISVIFFVFYYIISISGEKFVREDVWSPVTGMWISTFILLPIGIYLTYKSTNDAAIMSSEVYSQFFQQVWQTLRRFLPRKKHKRKEEK